MRLDKYLANSGIGTRSNIRKIIKNEKIYVNNILIKDISYNVDENIDIIRINDKIIKYTPFIYIMLNKPSGYVCANIDKKHKNIFELLNNKYSTYNLFVCGRLDIDTEGFVLITNDGNLTHKLLSPKLNKYKKYYVVLKNELNDIDIEKLKNGIEFKEYITKKDVIIEKINSKTCYISISEGKFHQVKKMFLAINNEVLYLKRISINNLYLDNNLKLGEYRLLTNDELNILKDGL